MGSSYHDELAQQPDPKMSDDELDDGVRAAATDAALVVLDLLVEASDEGNAERVEELADAIRVLLEE